MIRGEKLTKRFGATTALDAVDIDIREHATTVIMGGSLLTMPLQATAIKFAFSSTFEPTKNVGFG